MVQVRGCISPKHPLISLMDVAGSFCFDFKILHATQLDLSMTTVAGQDLFVAVDSLDFSLMQKM